MKSECGLGPVTGVSEETETIWQLNYIDRVGFEVLRPVIEESSIL
jgi:hypothetical protein